MNRFRIAPQPQHVQHRPERRKSTRYAVISCILAALIALPAVTNFQSPARADAPLKHPVPTPLLSIAPKVELARLFSMTREPIEAPLLLTTLTSVSSVE